METSRRVLSSRHARQRPAKGPPKFQPTQPVTEEARQAAFALVAQALREQASVYNVTLSDLTHAGQPIGSWEVSIRRID